MAPRGKTTQLHNMYVADFETCDDLSKQQISTDIKTGIAIYPQKVWLAGFKNLDTLKTTTFTTLDDFMGAILARGNNSNREYAFHNIKFDGSFIVPWLFANGFEHVNHKPKAKQFSTLVDERNNWYNITIQVTTKRKVTLWCSNKLFPCALEYLPDIYMTPTKKVREDQAFYTKDRGEDYKLTEQDLTYFENDLQVPAEALLAHIDMYGLRFKKTQASQAFYNFEQSFKAWKWRFPPLPDALDETIRFAYWGGISYAVPKHASKDHWGIRVMDISSSYPDKLANYKLPYGEPVSEFGQGKHPDMSKFWVASVICDFKLKENCLPCIPKRAIQEGEIIESKEFDTNKWLEDSHGLVKITLSSIDYETINQSYDFTVLSWEWTIHWAWKKHREIAKFVNYNNDRKVKFSKLAKVEKDPVKVREYLTIRNRAKIDNNSFYGKFGEEIVKVSKTPYYEDEETGVTWSSDNEQVMSEYKRKYLPVAIAITAWGRQQLVTLANILGEHFLYCDTDSVHYLRDGQYKVDKAEKNSIIEIDPEKLGAWSVEGTYKRGRFLRAKCYMEEKEDGTIEATVAGLPPDKHTGQFSKSRSCLTWDNFYIGHEVHHTESNKLRTVSTPTGNKLVPTGFKITEKEGAFSR